MNSKCPAPRLTRRAFAACSLTGHGLPSFTAPAVKLIRRINRNEQQLDDEFEHGASRIIASEDMFARDKQGSSPPRQPIKYIGHSSWA